MTSFKNPPLLEAIFELRWALDDNNDFNKIQFLFEDLYSRFSKEYPFRENIVDATIPLPVLNGQPVRRFRKAENAYPLIQIGPGILTLNSDSKNYLWEDFIGRSEKLINSFFELYPIDNKKMVGPSIVFLDFFKFDFQN